jgi:glutamate-ammonia-ligase adenylyltransferase
MSPRGRERLDVLMPRVLEAVAAEPRPTATLERVLNLLEAVARRSVYLGAAGRSSAGAWRNW